MTSKTSAAHEPSAPLTGKMLGRYRILSRLAVGGMAELWLADVPDGGQGSPPRVVLKTMLPSVAESPEFVRMFQSEAAIGAKLRHPNLVRVFDHGQLADRYFIAMEYIDGLTLRQIGQRVSDLGQIFPQRLLLSVVVEVCRGLHTAHELRDRTGLLQFVHRDVSPENIMVTRRGATKLIDFGAALTLRIPPNTARFVGKFRYVAPERIEGRSEDRRGDVYSLGVILYEFLTGVRPFEGDDLAMVSRILEGRPRSPQELVPGLDPALARITGKALSLDPRHRQPTAADLAAELLPLLEGPGHAAAAEETRQLLRRIFDGGQSPELEGEPAPTRPDSDAEAKTVEMEVDALKEVLRRTRDDTTVIRRMRGLRGRLVVSDPRTGSTPVRAAGARPARPGARTSSTPAPGAPSTGATPPVVAEQLPPTPRPTPFPTPAASSEPEAALPVSLPAGPPPEAPLSRSPSWLFERRERGGSEAMDGIFPARTGLEAPGWFDIRRPRGEPRAWARGDGAPEESPPAEPGNGTPQLAEPAPEPTFRRHPPVPEAVSCFDRGLSLLQDKLYAAALAEWEKALELDTDNRMYQVNVKRLRERIVVGGLYPRSGHEHEKRESQ